MARLHRLTAVVLATLVTAAGQVAICSGWKPTPEARKACCAAASTCPMRGRDAGGHRSQHRVSQAAADACCALSDTGHAPPSQAFLVAAPVILELSAIPAFEPAPIHVRPARPDESPPPASGLPRHLHLSVLLI